MTKPADSDQIAKARRISPDVLETARGYMAGKEPTLELMASFALAWQRLAEEHLRLPDELMDGAVKVIHPTDLRNRVGRFMVESYGLHIGSNVDAGKVQDMIVAFAASERQAVIEDCCRAVCSWCKGASQIHDSKPVLDAGHWKHLSANRSNTVHCLAAAIRSME